MVQAAYHTAKFIQERCAADVHAVFGGQVDLVCQIAADCLVHSAHGNYPTSGVDQKLDVLRLAELIQYRFVNAKPILFQIYGHADRRKL